MSNGSFTFCGTDIRSLGLSYAPEMSETFVYRPAEAQSAIETFEAHNGGYYYGSWSAPKDFTLRCFFEETNIDKGIMGKVYALFKVGRSGKLVFDRRPWCYYYATVTEPVQADFTNYLNGLITISLKAMYPFARSDIETCLRTDPNHDTMVANSAVFDKEGMELPKVYNLTEQTSIILANVGNERAALGIKVSGNVGDGIIITNSTTGQKCKMVAITKPNTTNVNRSVLVDPISGKTVLVGTGFKELAFKYHEYGFIELEPAYPAIRNLFIDQCMNNTVIVTNAIHEDLTGKYIFIKDKWNKILSQQDEHTFTVEGIISGSEKEKTMVIAMNEITVTPITTMDIRLEFIYKPTFA